MSDDASLLARSVNGRFGRRNPGRPASRRGWKHRIHGESTVDPRTFRDCGADGLNHPAPWSRRRARALRPSRKAT